MKISYDKIAHFGIGGLLTAVITIIAMLQEGNMNPSALLVVPFIGHVCTFILSVIKEYIVDDYTNWKDILAAMIGSLSIHISVVIGIIFNLLSK